jgi:hypothetical protein
MRKNGFLLIVRGLPGCGKTTVIDELFKLPEFSQAIRLDPDKVDTTSLEFASFCETFSLRSPDLPLKKKIYRCLLYRACSSLKEGKIVVWEQPWRSRELLLLTLENIGAIAYIMKDPLDLSVLPFFVGIVEISIKEDDAGKRVEVRSQKKEHPLTPEGFREFIGSLESFDGIGLPLKRFDTVKPACELAVAIKSFVQKIQQQESEG